MNIADRIQQLRKARGLSQEELADKIGVSRQAVSKWESEQSMPDIGKIIILSEYFEVTTDYILRGIEPIKDEKIIEKQKPNAGLFSIIGTAFNFIGVIVAAMLWYEKQTAIATGLGIVLIVIGCMTFALGMMISGADTKPKAKKVFWSINIWTLSFIPLSAVYNFLCGGFVGAPYPVLVGSYSLYLLFWMIYIAGGITATLAVLKRNRK